MLPPFSLAQVVFAPSVPDSVYLAKVSGDYARLVKQRLKSLPVLTKAITKKYITAVGSR
ncbi:hypothetical protein MKQ70_04130 [Chitinophaga sedimenti]|uniref:hypothetical protein n=1 Tax=Chitinophaga sedimenti TaxID=2033606 RepID=UPI002006BC6E|nr:hypothetical protein [Chitinophaga sedimenti]MCK7554242.1 hypothetical protein [Chitinophaga sedimenti]